MLPGVPFWLYFWELCPEKELQGFGAKKIFTVGLLFFQDWVGDLATLTKKGKKKEILKKKCMKPPPSSTKMERKKVCEIKKWNKGFLTPSLPPLLQKKSFDSARWMDVNELPTEYVRASEVSEWFFLKLLFFQLSSAREKARERERQK